jgi:hypothetical protein
VPLFSTANPVGPELKIMLIDGYEHSLTLGAAVQLIELINGDKFVIDNDCNCA